MTDFDKHPVMRAEAGIGINHFMGGMMTGADCRHVSGPAYPGSGPVTVQTPASSDYGHHERVMYNALCEESAGDGSQSGGAFWAHITSKKYTSREDPIDS